MGNNRLVEWEDEYGLPQLSLLSEDMPDYQAKEGIPLSIDIQWLDYPEPLRTKLYLALWEQGLKTIEDYKQPDSLKKIRTAIQTLLKMDANDIRLAVINSGD